MKTFEIPKKTLQSIYFNVFTKSDVGMAHRLDK